MKQHYRDRRYKMARKIFIGSRAQTREHALCFVTTSDSSALRSPGSSSALVVFTEASIGILHKAKDNSRG